MSSPWLAESICTDLKVPFLECSKSTRPYQAYCQQRVLQVFEGSEYPQQS